MPFEVVSKNSCEPLRAGAAVAAGPKLATAEADEALVAMNAKEIAALEARFRAAGTGCFDFVVSAGPGGDHMGDLRAATANRTVTSRQVATLVDALDVSEARCEAAVCLFGICVDRDDDWWMVLDALRGLEQSRVVTRLGFSATAYDTRGGGSKKVPRSMHYVLDCANPEHANVAKDLCAAAATLPWQAFQNLVVGGKSFPVYHAGTRVTWDDLCAAAVGRGAPAAAVKAAAPFIEVDFCGADVWERLNMEPIVAADGAHAGGADAAAAGADPAAAAAAATADAATASGDATTSVGESANANTTVDVDIDATSSSTGTGGGDIAGAGAAVVVGAAPDGGAGAAETADGAATAAAAAPAASVSAAEKELSRFFRKRAAILNADLIRQTHPFYLQLLATKHELIVPSSPPPAAVAEEGTGGGQGGGGGGKKVPKPNFPVVESPWFAPPAPSGRGGGGASLNSFDP